MSTVIDATIRMIVEGDHNRAYAALVDVLAQSPLTDEVPHSIVESFEHVNQEEADRWLAEQEKEYTQWLSLWLNPQRSVSGCSVCCIQEKVCPKQIISRSRMKEQEDSRCPGA